MRINEQFSQKLLVEGNDDQHVVWNFCKHFSLEKTFDVIDCESDDNLLKEISIRLKTDIQTLGIMMDADVNLGSRWQQLRDLLLKFGHNNVPKLLPEEGLVLKEEGAITIGVWLMPDNSINGMLEDFVKFLIPQDDKLIPIVSEVLQKIESQNLNRYTSVHKQKVEIHTWLAWQKKPGIPMGTAITSKYLNPETDRAKTFVEWLKVLFEV